MATTTNYGSTTPDDTDLVKDGAAAIRTLGSSVDTTTKALNPSTTLGDIEYRSATANTNTRLGIGSTGQVLTVAGGVPTWATSDDANAIQNAIVDAKGDIVAASAADTPARLAVGTDNQRLVAASGEATGLKYVADTQNTVIDAAGDLVYGTAADTLGRLGIGTAGQVLTVNSGATAPQWATAASGGGMTLLSTTATTSGSTVTISSISQDYKHLLVIATGLTASTNTDYSMRFNSNTASNYASFETSYVDTTLSGAFSNGTSISISAIGTSTSNANTSNFTLNIYRYSEGSEFKNATMYARSRSSVNVGRSHTISYGSNTAISSISLILDGGTFATGTVYIYGVK